MDVCHKMIVQSRLTLQDLKNLRFFFFFFYSCQINLGLFLQEEPLNLIRLRRASVSWINCVNYSICLALCRVFWDLRVTTWVFNCISNNFSVLCRCLSPFFFSLKNPFYKDYMECTTVEHSQRLYGCETHEHYVSKRIS